MSSWAAVVPVKRTEVAKSRLEAWAGPLRPALALAFAVDTVTALVSCVEHVVAVTDDDAAARALARAGAVVVADEPRRGLNPALVHGVATARRQRPGCAVACVSADLPALRPSEVSAVLLEADDHPTAFVADTAGLGTTLLACAPGVVCRPEFGPRSRARHRGAGVVEIDLSVPSVRRDVDTPVDLWDAARLGVGVATAAVLDRL